LDDGSPDSAPSDDAALPDGSYGVPVAVVQHVLVPPSILASDGTNLFWIDAQGLLWTAPTAGGTPKNLATNAYSFLAIEGTNVYFAEETTVSGPATVWEVSTDGGTATQLLALGSNVPGATIAGSQAYWTLRTGGGLVESEPLSGGPAQLLGSISPEFSGAAPLAATANHIFFMADESLAVMPVGGGPVTTGLTGGTNCQSLLASGDSVFCGGSPLLLVAPSGAMTQIALETNNVTSMALDDTAVYWVNNAPSGSVVAAPKLGGQNYVIAYDANPTAVAVDDTAVYWGDLAGNIQRAAKQ
jgi:hypothetical protein